jgi:hypothetical protein
MQAPALQQDNPDAAVQEFIRQRQSRGPGANDRKIRVDHRPRFDFAHVDDLHLTSPGLFSIERPVSQTATLRASGLYG